MQHSNSNRLKTCHERERHRKQYKNSKKREFFGKTAHMLMRSRKLRVGFEAVAAAAAADDNDDDVDDD